MYHAHIYFELEQQALASRIHELIRTSRSDITAIFPLVNRLVGPHTKPMFEVHFNDNRHGFIEWLDAHREGLSVLIHPVTPDELADHTLHAKWLGDVLPIKEEIF